MVLMIVGFLISRAILSISVIVFSIVSLYKIHPREWLKQKWWLLLLSWVALYILTYFWSDNKEMWASRLEVKLTVVILPLAFSLLPPFTKRQLKVFTTSICIVFLLSVGYSLSFILKDPEYYIHRYYMSNVLPVLAYKDHIRYSLSLALFSVWCLYFWPFIDSKSLRWFIGVSVAIFIAYLHLLAARTGLLSLYIFLFIWVSYLGLKRGKVFALTTSGLLVLFMYGLIMNVPTLKKKRDYFLYSIDKYREGERSGIYSDIGRIMSYDLAFRLIKQHPLLGVGSGDMKDEMTASYKKWYPEVSDENVLLPHNQFMIVALAAGIPAMLLFTLWVFAPLARLRRNRKSLFFFCTWLMLFVPLLIEPMLEVQFGVFVYLFFLLLQRHALIHDPETNRNDFSTTSKTNDELHTHISA